MLFTSESSRPWPGGVQTESLMEAVLGEGAGKEQDVSLREGPGKWGTCVFPVIEGRRSLDVGLGEGDPQGFECLNPGQAPGGGWRWGSRRIRVGDWREM